MRLAGIGCFVAFSLTCAAQAPSQRAATQPAGQIAAGTATIPPASAVASGAFRYDRAAISGVEAAVESRFRNLDTASPFNPLGACTGVYVSGYGMVFTAPLDLIATPQPSPFRPAITKQEMTAVHARKLAHLPPLRQAMKDLLIKAAGSFPGLAPNEKIALAARLYYMDWEDRTGLPAQIIVSADRASALAGNVQTEEF